MAAAAVCRGEWIIEADAEGRVTVALAEEIRRVIPSAGEAYFLIPIANHVGGKLIRHGWGAYNGAAMRAALYRPGGKRWGQGRVRPPGSHPGGPRVAQHPPRLFLPAALN